MKTSAEIDEILSRRSFARLSALETLGGMKAKIPGFDRAAAEKFLAEHARPFLAVCDGIDCFAAERQGRELEVLFSAVLDELFPDTSP